MELDGQNSEQAKCLVHWIRWWFLVDRPLQSALEIQIASMPTRSNELLCVRNVGL